MKKLVLLALLVAATASAEFTPAEKAEIAKVVLQQTNLATPYNQLGDGIRDYADEALRPAFVATLTAAVDASWECHEALSGLFQVGGTTAEGKAFVTGCLNKGLEFATSMDVLADAVVAAKPEAAQWGASIRSLASKVRAGKLATFNHALDYANPRPVSFPTVVGPHGDFESAEHHLDEMGAMFLRAVALGIALYKQADVWPANANGDFREFIRYAVTPVKNTARIWGLQHGIYATSGDSQDVQDDLAAASAIGVQRGEAFFITLHTNELFNGDPHQPPLFSGRTQAGGNVPNFAIGFAEFPKAWRDIIEVNTHAEVYSWFCCGVKNLGASAPTLARITSNIIPQWSEALSNAWKAGDKWNNSIFMFFHQVTNVCGPGTHASNGMCVPDGSGSAATCGTGTHLEGTVCVADPCPECPPPPTCPEQTVEFLSVSPDGQLVAQCVEP